MDKSLEIELVKKYPKILKNYGGDCRQTCMSWGFDFENGWNALIHECLEKLQYFCDLCSKDGREVLIIADQAKEKYGTLRFYVSVYGATDIENKIIDDIIAEAERKSKNICEVTGEDGATCKKGSWLKTLSRKEARKLGYVACNEELEKYWKTKDEKEANS